MLEDNIKALRKRKGFTQEEFAKRLNVVRQTVSKWEKGLSVPDAQMLSLMAEEFDVSVQEILGAEIAEEINGNEIAEQLARINEYLVVRNSKAARRWKIACAVLALLLIASVCAVVMHGRNTKGNEIPETISVNSISVEINKNELSFCPSAGNSEYTYAVIFKSEDYSYMDAIRQTASYSDGICTAAIPDEVKNSGNYSVTLIIEFGTEERTVGLMSSFIIEGNSVSYTEIKE